ncbi:branched-chain amino acid ABC transporter permease/ATP-binding protein [Parafrankia discariae]|uniref:branched-chain amino acid ABC transporter permease/ATP-binding protein n=1 Tax=Parafrankia discariae TaxID=365528 RepID=UPI00037CFAED|nr:branched-chain amino acid ABC transporter permease/ATP-binding protein [Parafrankia discariae]
MNDFLPFIVIGLATGAVYGLAGIGLVLTYKTSGIFNFGYGAVATLVAFCFYFLNVDHGWPWPLAAAVSLLVFAPSLGLVLELLARSLGGAGETIKVVATVGLILAVSSVGLLWHPINPPTFPHFLPQDTVRLVGVNVTWEEIILFLLSAVAAAGLYWFFRSVRFGIVMRGVVDNHELVSMSGDDPVLIRRWAWVIGSVFAGVAGLLLAPSHDLDGVTLTTIVFAAFGAAAIGYFSNLPLTFAGGLVVGIASSLVDKYSATVTWIGGLPPALPFVILFVALIVLPRRLLAQRRLTAVLSTRRSYRAPVRIRLTTFAIAIVLLGLVPTIQSGHIAVWSSALINIMLFLSLGLLVRRSGQISLCHLAFAAVGAAAFGHFSASMPWLPALVLATLVAIPVGALISIPAVRVSGVFLALATLGLGILAEQVFYTRDFMFSQSALGIEAPRPVFSLGGLDLSSDKGFYYLLLVITVLVAGVITAIGHGRLGRLLEALADSPLALETHGTTSSVLKVIVFCLTAAIASLAGALNAMLFHFGVGTYYPSFSSLTLVALVVIVTIGDPWYALVAAVGYSVLPAYITGQNTSTVLNLLFGLGAATAAWGTRGGVTPARLQTLLNRLGGRSAPETPDAPGAPDIPVTADAARQQSSPRREAPAGDGLTVRGLSVRFGGVHAVNGVTLRARPGAVTGLIGPNGAGKTTTFNACSGLLRPSSGEVLLHGTDVTGEGPASRARHGLGRTFQRTELFNSLTVRQNVALGREASLAGANPLTHLVGSRRANRVIARVVDESLALTGTTRIADLQVGLLPIGQRRLVELARALAGPFDMLLLDEPSSGLDGHETEQFGQVLRTVVRERGCGVLLVEHDMTLVREICDYLYVLDFGQPIFEGTPVQMENSDRVRSAYLGGVAVPVDAQDAPSTDRSAPLQPRR